MELGKDVDVNGWGPSVNVDFPLGVLMTMINVDFALDFRSHGHFYICT